MQDPKPTKKVKLHTCKQCKNKYEKTNPNPLVNWCSAECGAKIAMVRLDKQKQNALAKDKARRKDEKNDLKTLGDYTKDLQTKINLIVRNIDTNFPCISSNRTTGQFHGGHYYSTGSKPSLRFHLYNIWKQSAMDNNHKSGNIHDYTTNLCRLFGRDWVHENIMELSAKYPTLKLTIDDIKARVVICNQIIREQNAGDWVALESQERIEIRDALQKRLMIYG